MPRVMRLVKVALGAVAAALAVWFRAVTATPEVKARKRARRQARALTKR